MAGFRSSSSNQIIGWTAGPPAVATEDTLVIAAPAGIQAGDILVAGFGINSQVSPQGDFNCKLVPVGTTWTAAVGASSNVAGFLRVLYRVATASEPSSYTFQVRAQNGVTVRQAYVIGIIGAWEGFGPPIPLALSGTSRYDEATSGNTVPFPGPANVPDIDSLTITGAETTTGGLAVYFWDIRSGIENFDGTIGTEGNPPYPASSPYNDITSQNSPLTQHEKDFYDGVPSNGEPEWSPIHTTGITYRAENMMLAMGSTVLSAGGVGSGTANFTWQHAGAEAGYGENAEVYRLVLTAAVPQAYWGVLAVPL